jgi:uncharacterized protein
MDSTAQTATLASPRSRARRWLARLMFSLIVLALALYVGVSVLAASMLTVPRRVVSAATPAALGLAFQDVQFPAQVDAVPISGWYIPHDGSHEAIVLVHGKDSNRTNEFGGRFPNLAAALHERGFAILMIDMRGHGQSGDGRYSFGLNEQRDIAGAADWLRTQGFLRGSIGVLGVSMGAASSMFAAANDPDIGALIEDCGYADINPILAHEWSTASGLPNMFLPSSLFAARMMYGYDISAAQPVAEVGKIAPRPMLIIHGTADTLIPVAQAEQIKAANPAAELWEVAGAGHAGSYAADPQAYVDRVASFFAKSLQ